MDCTMVNHHETTAWDSIFQYVSKKLSASKSRKSKDLLRKIPILPHIFF